MTGVSGVGTGPVITLNRTDLLDQASGGQSVDATGNPLPPATSSGDAPVASSVPSLPPSMMTDATELLSKVLTLRIKCGDEQMKGTMDGIKGDGIIRRNQADEAAKKTKEAMEKQASASKNSNIMKILGWVGVALAVVAAVAISVVSLGTATAVAALAVAAVVVAMAVLNETGQFDKMQTAIQESLQKPPSNMSEDDAKKWAMGLNMAIQITVMIICTVATFGAGSASSASAAIQVSANVARAARIASTTAEISGSASTIAQQGMAVDSAIKQRDASNLQADVLDIKALIAKLQAAMEDGQESLQQMLQDASAFVAKVVQQLGSQADTTDEITKHMGAMG